MIYSKLTFRHSFQSWLAMLKRISSPGRCKNRVRRLINGAKVSIVLPVFLRKPATTNRQTDIIGKALSHTSLYILEQNQLSMYYFVTLLRLLKFLLVLGPVLFLYPITLSGEVARSMWLRWLVSAVELYGGALIKLGQWASTRPDLFSSEFCNAMSRLQRHVSPHPYSHTAYKLKKRLGGKWRKLIKRLNKEPVGAGCIAQVYSAYLDVNSIKDEQLADDLTKEFIDNTEYTNWFEAFEIMGYHGEPVYEDTDEQNEDVPEHWLPIAIKVLRPGVRQSIISDIGILKSAAWIAELVVPSLHYGSVLECVNEFSRSMLKQLDLRVEADNYDAFTDIFKDDPGVRFPRPVRPFVWKDLILMSLEKGIPISHFLPGHVQGVSYMDEIDTNQDDTSSKCTNQGEVVKEEELRASLAENGLNLLLKMIFTHNFVHTDMHPGNIAVNLSLNRGYEKEKIELVNLFDTVMVKIIPNPNPFSLILYDCGLVTRLSSDKHKSITEVFTAVAQNDGLRVAQLFLENSVTHKTTDCKVFTEEMTQFIDISMGDGLALKQLEVGNILRGFLSVLAKHHVRLDANFVNIMISVVIAEGLGKSLNADLDVLTLLRQHLSL